ncbi:pseudouridine synthase [Brachybacterium sp. Z12]|uniref:pseudouridine synthase n=1 Tax=Brachybacterium sp. Z12 TaxID=2759167 RepID=UPI00223AF08A|nr:pseudouridine synthase [Brachybacterium sp. Z12]
MGAVSPASDRPGQGAGENERAPGRAARRRARRLPPPLPQRDGLDAVRWQAPPGTPPGAAALEALRERFPALADPAATALRERFDAGEIVDRTGRAWSADDPLRAGDELWFHRELRSEHVPEVDLRILHRDEHLLVLDKPHDMATMPRGAHILASALVRLRRETGIESLVPLHRLDRRTAGVLAFGIRPEERSAYQQLFARGEVHKEYEARVLPADSATLPRVTGETCTMRDHLVKRRGELTAQVLDAAPNAETVLEVVQAQADDALVLRLRPRTGRTHQLRVQLASRGAPILGRTSTGRGSDRSRPRRSGRRVCRCSCWHDASPSSTRSPGPSGTSPAPRCSATPDPGLVP